MAILTRQTADVYIFVCTYGHCKEPQPSQFNNQKDNTVKMWISTKYGSLVSTRWFTVINR